MAAVLVMSALMLMSVPGVAARCDAPALIDDGWQVQAAEAAGIDAQALCTALATIDTGEGNIHAVVVERGGRLVAEAYRKGPDRPITVLYGLWNPFAADTNFGPATLHDVRSVSKSVVGLLVGQALQQGTLRGLDTPVLDFYPELTGLRSPERNAITLRHLLSMSSGLAWDEGSLPNDETRLFWESEPARFVLGRPLVSVPGQTFNYHSGGTAVLADVLVRTNGKSLRELVRSQLFDPMGITHWEWAANLHGRELAFTGLRMRPRDLAKIGRLMLDQGQWRGRQLVPAAWVTTSLAPHIKTSLRVPPTAAEPLAYGYQWWAGSVDWQGRRVPWGAAFGNGGQRLFVVPELDLVVVIAAGAYGSQDVVPLVDRLFRQVVMAVRE